MLSQSEIEKLLKKKEVVVADKKVMEQASLWDLSSTDATPQLIATIYSYMKTNYQSGDSLDQMESKTGIAKDMISRAIRQLECHGFLTVARVNKPFRYLVVK